MYIKWVIFAFSIDITSKEITLLRYMYREISATVTIALFFIFFKLSSRLPQFPLFNKIKLIPDWVTFYISAAGVPVVSPQCPVQHYPEAAILSEQRLIFLCVFYIIRSNIVVFDSDTK